MAVRSRESVGRPGTRTPVKERLLSVATRLFARHGFESTSVQDIVDAAGVTKGAMYHYYGSKDDLLYEVYHQVLSMQTSHLDEIAAGPGTAEERLRAAAAALVQTSLDNLVVHYFLSVINQLGSWYKPEGQLSPAQVGEKFTELLIGGLATR